MWLCSLRELSVTDHDALAREVLWVVSTNRIREQNGRLTSFMIIWFGCPCGEESNAPVALMLPITSGLTIVHARISVLGVARQSYDECLLTVSSRTMVSPRV